MTTQNLIGQLAAAGGAIVSSNECSQIEIAEARCHERFAVDADGYGYVRRPAEWLALQKSRELGTDPARTVRCWVCQRAMECRSGFYICDDCESEYLALREHSADLDTIAKLAVGLLVSAMEWGLNAHQFDARIANKNREEIMSFLDHRAKQFVEKFRLRADTISLGGGGGSENLPAALEKYNDDSTTDSSITNRGDGHE